MKEKLSKSDLRRQMRAKGLAWAQKPEAERAQTQVKIQSSLKNVLAQASGIWAGYSALADEPNCEITEAVGVTKVRWAYPMVEGATLRFFIPRKNLQTKENPEACFRKATFGILEPLPATCDEVGVNELTGVLVPGLAFDRKGIRLGRGKGFYDRTLAQFSGTKMGIAFAWQIAETDLPSEIHDIPMDIVVTESEVIRREQKS